MRLPCVSDRTALIRRVLTDDTGAYVFRTGPGDYTLGTVELVDHDTGRSSKLTVNQQKEIKQDFQPEKPELGKFLAQGLTGAISFAHLENVFDGTMVYQSCQYCHYPSSRR